MVERRDEARVPAHPICGDGPAPTFARAGADRLYQDRARVDVAVDARLRRLRDGFAHGRGRERVAVGDPERYQIFVEAAPLARGILAAVVRAGPLVKCAPSRRRGGASASRGARRLMLVLVGRASAAGVVRVCCFTPVRARRVRCSAAPAGSQAARAVNDRFSQQQLIACCVTASRARLQRMPRVLGVLPRCWPC